LNAWTNLYETWYVCHGTWAHLNGVLHKSAPSVCVSVCVSLLSLRGKGSVKCITPFVARLRLGKHVPAATNKRNNRRIVGGVWCVCLSVYPPIFAKKQLGRDVPARTKNCSVRVLSKESRRLVLPRTSCWSNVKLIPCHHAVGSNSWFR
jgi:hypothetical protein